MHSHYKSNAQDDSLAQLVEHNTFNVGVLGSSPRRITETLDRNGQKWTVNVQLLQYQGIVGVFSLYNVCDLRHEKVTKRHTFVTNS